MTPLRAVLHFAIPALWLGWILSWIIAAGNVKRARWREPAGAQLLHGLPFFACVLLLIGPRWLPAVLMARLVPPGPGFPLAGTAMVAGGVALAVWARVHLGRNWSGRVEVKEDHALICTGPYRMVRHPIYSGLLLALAGTALAIGEWRGVLAVGLALLGILRRIRVEERRMGETFPEYARYRSRTAALVPGLF